MWAGYDRWALGPLIPTHRSSGFDELKEKALVWSIETPDFFQEICCVIGLQYEIDK
jgi:hypothetical protein